MLPMGEALILHPESSCRAVTGIEVEAARPRPGVLVLTYAVSGRTGGLALPAPAAPVALAPLPARFRRVKPPQERGVTTGPTERAASRPSPGLFLFCSIRP
jgi:hypothetical protein